jgi:CRP-like cAMP-binding protein
VADRYAGVRDADEVCAKSWPEAVQCLLDLDADLAETVAPQARRVVRAAATVTVLDGDPGRLPVPTWLARTAGGPGVLVLDGVLAQAVRVGDRVSAELLGTGDVIQAAGAETEQLVSCDIAWRALTPTRVALLDSSFVRRLRFWPEIDQALLHRAGRRALSLDVQRAIAAQPRLEVRLALLLWHLASRWGQVERGGVRLPVPLTHQLLGQLIAAERPSVSHALARLAGSGLVTGHGDEWHLQGPLEDQWAQSVAPAPGRAERVVAALDAMRVGA